MIITLTGPSGSGKTTVMNILSEKLSYKIPTSFTTRPPREDDTNYSYVSEAMFLELLKNGTLFEHTLYRNNFYGYAMQSHNSIYILEPAGLAQAICHFERERIPYKSFYLDVDKDEAKRRMIARGDDEHEAEARASEDALTFFSVGRKLCSHYVNANLSIESVTEEIISSLS